MPISAAAATIGSALIGGGASVLGANRASSAARSAAALQDRQYQQTREDLAPWRTAGVDALGQVTGLMGLDGDEARTNALSRFATSPDYNFRFDEGLRALDRSAASRGMLMSGAQTRAAQGFGQNLASGEYNNYLARLMGVSEAGRGTVNALAQFGAGAAAGQGNALIGAGQNTAAGYIGAANALNSGVQNALYAQRSGQSSYGTFADGSPRMSGGVQWNTPRLM